MSEKPMDKNQYEKLSNEYLRIAATLRSQANPSYLTALQDMDKRLSVLAQQRDDARAELDNVTPLIAQSTRLVGALGTELAQALSEIAQLRIALRERNELIATLTDQ